MYQEIIEKLHKHFTVALGAHVQPRPHLLLVIPSYLQIGSCCRINFQLQLML